MHVSLIVPAPFEQISGGYAYDRRMVEGLRATGHEISVIELPGSFPVTEETTRQAAGAICEALAGGTYPVIDGLALPAFAGLEETLAARTCVGLIHHPTALETGLSDTAREELQAIERRLYWHLRKILVTSATTAARVVAEFGVARNKIAVVVPGTDEAPRCTGSGSSVCQILSIGALVPRKGHDVLLRAVARLFDLNWHLTIVGTPDRHPVHAHKLARLAEELNITQQVRFAGEVTDQELYALWRAADVFALATRYEGYGMAIAEALKRGLPVAVTAGGSAAELVGPEAGAVCQPGDHQQLSKALRRLIFNPELRREMGEAAWKIGQTLPSWSAQAEIFARALDVR
ncbi:MAG: glycosyltransferase family 4 protein [Acetobacteraceae bacterium]|nr:glycosyltransferase family 4 protein [Acetobacteraceae bacterium]